MKLVQADTQRAYEWIREKIITLDLAPGALIDEQRLAAAIDLPTAPVREALKLLAHEELVVVTPRHGLYVADINLADLQQLSELRLSLESLCVRLAAERAAPDDIAVLENLCRQQQALAADDSLGLFDLDHKFHRALVAAARNRYLSRTLEHLFGLSQRLWYRALPGLEFLPAAVAEHLPLVDAVKAGQGPRAVELMQSHVQGFYDRVRGVLEKGK